MIDEVKATQARQARLPEGLRQLYYMIGQDQAEIIIMYPRDTADIIASTREAIEESLALLERVALRDGTYYHRRQCLSAERLLRQCWSRLQER